MRSMLLFLAVAVPAAADVPEQNEKATDELRGIWVGKTAVRSNDQAKFEGVWEFQEDKIVTTLRDRTTEWKYRSDPKKSPKEIDLTPSSGPGAGKTLKGVYKIKEDILTVCYVRVGVDRAETRDRPAEFDAKKRDDVVILTFERKKP